MARLVTSETCSATSWCTGTGCWLHQAEPGGRHRQGLSEFDLDQGTEVRVNHDAKVVHVLLPPAAVLGVEVTDLKTYDEQRGLWNPFRPADRDTIFTWPASSS